MPDLRGKASEPRGRATLPPRGQATSSEGLAVPVRASCESSAGDNVDTEAEPLQETLTHRLVLPRDANHHGTLYAGTLLALALEAGYAAAYRAAGASANLVLKRVLDLRCFEPVPVGEVVAIRGVEVFRARAQVVVALFGQPLNGHARPWMDGLMQFVQVDNTGRPEPLEDEPPQAPPALPSPWQELRARAHKLLALRT